jgi:hypothetical protein
MQALVVTFDTMAAFATGLYRGLPNLVSTIVLTFAEPSHFLLEVCNNATVKDIEQLEKIPRHA